jgi:cytochrome c peroxidase
MSRLLQCLALAAAACDADKLPIPTGLDAYMPVPAANPLTRAKAELGRKLFFDPRLSHDGSISCATCHDPAQAFSDSRPFSFGIGGQAAPRRTPRIANRAWGQSFFWDGRAPSLEVQVLQPIANPVEMGSTPEEAARRTGLTVAELRDALASYVRTIVSGDAPFDRYMAGDPAALDGAERAGMELFTGKAGCASCHVGPNFTDERFHNTGAGAKPDPGRGAVTGRETYRGTFKTPSLRDCARTPPFMHDGSLPTLEAVIDFYDKGGRSNPNLDPEIRPLHLTAAEKSALAAFLRGLNGKIRDGF